GLGLLRHKRSNSSSRGARNARVSKDAGPPVASWFETRFALLTMRSLSRRRSACRHLAADFGAQLVDQLEAALGLDMPEGPAVAGFRALGDRAHAVDRADLVAEHDGAVGADQR